MLLRAMFHDLFGASATSKLLLGKVEGNIAWYLARQLQVSWTVGSHGPQMVHFTS